MPFDASAFETARQVTVPFLIMEPDQKYYVRFDEAIKADDTSFTERVRKSRKEESENKEPIHIAKVTNLATDSTCKLVAHSTLESNLNEAYKEQSYVGKMFQIEKKSKAQGKRYFTFEIVEIRLKQSGAPAEPQTKKR